MTVNTVTKDDTVRVVYALVCSKCESCNGERVDTLARAKAEEECELDKETFFRYKDTRHNAEYRQLTYQHGCRNC